jgi:hypothetical protein
MVFAQVDVAQLELFAAGDPLGRVLERNVVELEVLVPDFHQALLFGSFFVCV